MSCSFCNNNHLVSHLYHFYTFSALFGDYKSRFHQKNSGAKGIRCKNVLLFILKCITIRQKNNFLCQFWNFSPKFCSTTSLWNLLKKPNIYILAVRLLLGWVHYFIKHEEMGWKGSILFLLFREHLHWAGTCVMYKFCLYTCTIYIYTT